MPQTALRILFSCILLSLLLYSAWAAVQQPVWQWGALTGPDRYWNIAMSAYVLLQLFRLRPEEPASGILTARNP
jgi:hypothetical protein